MIRKENMLESDIFDFNPVVENPNFGDTLRLRVLEKNRGERVYRVPVVSIEELGSIVREYFIRLVLEGNYKIGSIEPILRVASSAELIEHAMELKIPKGAIPAVFVLISMQAAHEINSLLMDDLGDQSILQLSGKTGDPIKMVRHKIYMLDKLTGGEQNG